MKPIRIQRKRTKGWKMPDGVVYVGRGSRWGNPFSMSVIHHAAACGLMDEGEPPDLRCDQILPSKGWVTTCALAACTMYRGLVENAPVDQQKAFLAPLRGKDLACWCPLDRACHADILLELANAPPSGSEG